MVQYSKLNDKITKEIKDDAIKTGSILSTHEPAQYFANIVTKADNKRRERLK